MLGYLARRVAMTLPVMGVVALIVFALLHLAPGDPASIMAGDAASPAELAEIRARLGLDAPLAVQFVTWLGQILQGNLGLSLHSHKPVAEMIGSRLGPTLSLAVATVTVSLLVAIPMGVYAAWRRGRLSDRLVMAVAVLGFSTPVFVVGYGLIYLLSLKAGWFPVQGFTALTIDPIRFLRTATLPTLTLSTVYIALVARITRSSVLEVLGEDFVRTARAKGVPEARIVLRHALRNAAVPIVTVVGSGAAFLIGGVVVTESVFNIPGLGRLVVESVLARDYPLIQSLILLLSLVYILINLAVDVLYTVFDPRIRY
ncbi:ABC transporter permease [Methylobacterium frigidaeris]|uniref:Glutathione transport system permease protein GsiC n=1 Tax=Methylobacterium frigidaeris TaxID=2038277 RepID=A0AA37HF05_9HYPH|nr:ABC transporter permease [Methylobacterium frigidaeris]PIK70828.1 peptide ABC transporter [Methylobacterium frigidaeris]GJD64311.1 Glutathione transport system permease protein GsiC [Methylobacterium frigidaeris]